VSIDETPCSHIEDPALLALLDGESTAAERDGLQDHLGECVECTRRLDELRFADRRVRAGLEMLDVPSPFTTMPPALVAASRGTSTAIRTPPTRGIRMGRRSVAAAAGLILVLTAGAYAIPGSPVRDILGRTASAIATLFSESTGPADPGPSQVAVDAVGGSIRISIVEASADLRIRIRMTSALRASVSAREAEFGVEAGAIEVHDPSGDMTIALPEAAESVVKVNGVAVARLVDGSLMKADGAETSPATIILETDG